MGKQSCTITGGSHKTKESLVAQLGRNWNNGLNNGAFYWNVNNTPSNRNRNISSHLVNAQNSTLETQGAVLL
jgi:hypothetical protein